MVILDQNKDMPTPIDALVQKPSPTHHLEHPLTSRSGVFLMVYGSQTTSGGLQDFEPDVVFNLFNKFQSLSFQ